MIMTQRRVGYMKDQNGSNNTFTFSHVTMNVVLKELRSINMRKTTGCDLIPGKLIKEGADFLCKPIQSLIINLLIHVHFLTH